MFQYIVHGSFEGSLSVPGLGRFNLRPRQLRFQSRNLHLLGERCLVS